MKKSLNLVLAALLASGASVAIARPANAMAATAAQRFEDQFNTLQQESTAMPAGSPAVDRSAKPEDPIAKATTLAQEEARFRTDEKRFQQESTAMPAGSPQVNPHERAADPLRKATTRAQKAAAFAAEEHFFQQRSTPWNGSARRA